MLLSRLPKNLASSFCLLLSSRWGGLSKALIAAVILFWIGTAGAWGQQANVSVTLDKSSFRVGEIITATITSDVVLNVYSYLAFTDSQNTDTKAIDVSNGAGINIYKFPAPLKPGAYYLSFYYRYYSYIDAEEIITQIDDNSRPSITVSALDSRSLTLTADKTSATVRETVTVSASTSLGSGTITYSKVSGVNCSVNATSGVVSATAAESACQVKASITSDGTYTAVDSDTVTIAFTAAPQGPASLTAEISDTTPLVDTNVKITVSFDVAPPAGTIIFGYLSTNDGSFESQGYFPATAKSMERTPKVLAGKQARYYTATISGITLTSNTITYTGLQSRSLSLAASPTSLVYTSSSTLSASPSAGAGTITYSKVSGSYCSVDSNSGRVSTTQPGDCVVKASITSDGTYTAVDSNTVTIAFYGTISTTLNQTTLKELTVGAASSFTPVTGNGGSGGITYSIAPALPSGLSLNTSSGLISGAASAAAPNNVTYRVTVTDSSQATAFADFSLRINAAITATGGTAYSLTIGTAMTASKPVTASGGTGSLTFRISSGTLPSGLTMANDGTLSGTPTVSSTLTNTYTVTVTDANNATATATFTIKVNRVVSATGGTSYSLTKNKAMTDSTPITATDGTAPLTYQITDGTLPAGLSFSSAGVLSGTPTSVSAQATYKVTARDANGATATATFTLAVNDGISTTGGTTYTLTKGQAMTDSTPITATGGTGTLTYQITVGTLPAGLSFSSAGVLSGTPTAVSAQATYTVTVTDSNNTTATNTFTLAVSDGISTTGGTTYTLTKGQAMTPTNPVTATGGTGTLTYQITDGTLPAGLSFSSAGVLSGTPTAVSAQATYKVTARDANGASATATFTLAVNDEISTTGGTSYSLTKNKAMTPTNPVTATGGTGTLTYQITVGTLPAGLSFSSAGVLSGTPTSVSAQATYTVTARDANGATATATFMLLVSESVSATVAKSTTTLFVNFDAPSFTPVTGTGGTAPLSYSVNPALPQGLSFNSNTGAITGRPTTVLNNASFTITVTDANQSQASASFTLSIVKTGTNIQVTASDAAPIFGKPITLTATVTPAAATGTVQFKDNNGNLGTPVAVSNGVATLPVSTLSVGSHSITAVYSGDATYDTATSAPVSVTPSRPNPANDAKVKALVANQVQTVQRISTQQIDMVHRRLETLHEDNVPAFVNGLSVAPSANVRAYSPVDPLFFAEQGKKSAAVAALEKTSQPQMSAPSSEKSLGPDYFIWTSGMISVAHDKFESVPEKSRMDSQSITFGIDTRVIENFKAGLAVSAYTGRSKFDELGTRDRTRALMASLYGSFDVGDGIFIDGLVGLGQTRFKTERYNANAIGVITGSRNGLVIFSSLGASYDQKLGALKYAPYARLDVVHAWLDTYAENGDANWTLAFAKSTPSSQAAVLGLRGQYDIPQGTGTLSPTLRVEYRHSFSGSVTQDVNYVSDPSTVYSINVTGVKRDTITGSIGLKATGEGNLSGQIEYSASLSTPGGGFAGQGLRGTLRLAF